MYAFCAAAVAFCGCVSRLWLWFVSRLWLWFLSPYTAGGVSFAWYVCFVLLLWICFITSVARVTLTQWQATRILILCNPLFILPVQRILLGTGVQCTGPIAAFVISVAFFGDGVHLGNPAFTALVIQTTVLHHPAAQCGSCTRQQQHGKAQQRHGFVGYLGGWPVWPPRGGFQRPLEPKWLRCITFLCSCKNGVSDAIAESIAVISVTSLQDFINLSNQLTNEDTIGHRFFLGKMLPTLLSFFTANVFLAHLSQQLSS